MNPMIAKPPLGGWSRVGEAFVRSLGLQVVSPPETTQRTLNLGVRYCPETMCPPCKPLFGDYLEAAEQGANTIVMLGGAGMCRLGYSAERHRQMLEDLGYLCGVLRVDLLSVQCDMVRLTREMTAGRPPHTLLEPLRMLMALLRVTDQLESQALALRPRELEPGAVDRAQSEATSRLSAIRSRQQLEAESDAIVHIV